MTEIISLILKGSRLVLRDHWTSYKNIKISTNFTHDRTSKEANWIIEILSDTVSYHLKDAFHYREITLWIFEAILLYKKLW